MTCFETQTLPLQFSSKHTRTSSQAKDFVYVEVTCIKIKALAFSPLSEKTCIKYSNDPALYKTCIVRDLWSNKLIFISLKNQHLLLAEMPQIQRGIQYFASATFICFDVNLLGNTVVIPVNWLSVIKKDDLILLCL